MHILVIDGNHVEAEFREKFGPGHAYSFFTPESATTREAPTSFTQRLETALAASEVVFDFVGLLLTMGQINIPLHLPVFQEASGAAESTGSPATAIGFGFCGLPTLLNRSLLEVSLPNEADRERLATTCAALGTDYRVVAARVGLVTPRVICMVINEACFTVQEGTATMQAVDLGMKLGTSYPRGPFAWANAIGVERVYAVLDAMWHDTHDERYKVCPLLKRHALRREAFEV